MTAPAIRFDKTSIMFGDNKQRAFELADQGLDRAAIKDETGAVLGVHDASLDVMPGEIVVLMGLSGSGKSTLLRAVNRLNPISRGRVEVTTKDGAVDVGKCTPDALRRLRGQAVSMVFQQFALMPWRTVAENVGLGLEIAGVSEAERKGAVDEQLELVGLADWRDTPISSLSGGMQQRVGLARAFATGAPILLMDEPFSALDPLIRNRLQDELLNLQAKLKKTILFVSHDLDEAIKLGNRIAIMEGGRIVQSGTPRDILFNPQTDYVRDFVAHVNPLSMLAPEDVALPAETLSKDTRLAGTARRDTPLSSIISRLAHEDGAIGLIDGGRIAGAITARSVLAAINGLRGTETKAKIENKDDTP